MRRVTPDAPVACQGLSGRCAFPARSQARRNDMIVHQAALLVALLALVASPFVVGPGASAQQLPPATAAERCRAFDEAGLLDPLGNTLGECVNILSGPASSEANNRIAAVCGREL